MLRVNNSPKQLQLRRSNVLWTYFTYFSSFSYRLTLNRWMRRGEMKFAEWDALIFDLMFWLKVFLNFPYFVSDVVLVSLLLTLNVFYTFYNFFHSWLWPCKYFLVEWSYFWLDASVESSLKLSLFRDMCQFQTK